jgi:hypothetical protein
MKFERWVGKKMLWLALAAALVLLAAMLPAAVEAENRPVITGYGVPICD